MPDTFTLIEAKTITTPSASIVFSTIPSTYTDLKILYSGKSTSTAAQGTFIQFNGVSSSLSSKYIIGDGGSPSTGNLGYLYAGSTWGTNGSTDVFNFSEIYIPNAFSTQQKSYMVMNSAEKQDPASYMNVIVGKADTVTSAITSVTVDCGGGNWIANSTFYLYGIKSS
jgi:hypothetical protein